MAGARNLKTASACDNVAACVCMLSAAACSTKAAFCCVNSSICEIARLAAISQACLLRSRPIMLITAAMLGGLPLSLAGGSGTELRGPLSVAMIGGLVVSQMLPLSTTPVVYLAFERLSRRWRGRKARRKK